MIFSVFGVSKCLTAISVPLIKSIRFSPLGIWTKTHRDWLVVVSGVVRSLGL